MACDEHVLANTEDPRAYAECLVALAERGFVHRAAVLAQGAVHRVKECAARITQILANGRPRTAGASRVALLSAASASIFLMATFAQAPNLIAFSSPAPSRATATPSSHLSDPQVTRAAWHPASQSTPLVTPAVYVEHPATVKQLSKAATSSARRTPAVRSSAALQRAAHSNSAPRVYRAGFTQPQTNALPAELVIVQQTDFYSDGARVWAVSTYHMAVFRPQPATPNDISRKTI
jgi:hypothetical protein